MAKRYHQSKAARHHEHEAMERYERGPVRHHSDHYAGMDARRRQELEDAGMIHEDHRAIANLPQEVMIKHYPKAGSYLPEGLDDTIHGVDRQIGMDDSQRAKHNVPKKV